MAVEQIDLELIHDNPYQARSAYHKQDIDDLAHSIKTHGLLQVPPGRRKDGNVELGFGHLRKRAFAKLAKKEPEKWGKMPIDIRELTDEQMAMFALEENLKRRDITPLETARAVDNYLNSFLEKTEVELAESLNMTKGNVSNMRRVLRLPEKVLEKIDEGRINFTQGRELIILEKLENSEELMRTAIRGVRTEGGYGYHANTVEGMQASVHGVISDRCRPLDKQFEGYRYDLLFDTRAAGCLECDKMLRTHPTKSATAHYCLDDKCWDRHQEEHREKASTAAKAKMQAEVINRAAQEIAQEEKPPAAPVMIDENTVCVDQETFAKIEASYSADRISEGTAVRKPVEFEGNLYLATGGGMGKEEAYQLVPRAEFIGEVRTYKVPAGREYEEYYESLRNDPNGFYHGMLVKRGQVEHVLVGPEVTFVTKVDEGDFSQEKSVQWRCGQCNAYFEFSPPGDNSKALVKCPSCQYEYVTYRRADGVLFCLPKHNYNELPKVKIPSTLLSAADEEQLENQADERDRQMEEARERANLERPVGELPCDTCLKGETCDRSFFHVADDDSDRLVCEQWECDHVSWALPKEPAQAVPDQLKQDISRRIAEAPAPAPQEIPEDILTLAKQKAGTRAEVLDVNDIVNKDYYRREVKSGYTILKGWYQDELCYMDDPTECTERCTHGFHFGFDSKDKEGRVFFICTDTKCAAKKKAAFTRAKNAEGQARKKAEVKAVKEAIAQTTTLDRPRIKLILLAQMDGQHTQRYYYDGGKKPETWLWEKISAGTPAIDRKRQDLFKRIDKLTDEELAKLVVEFMFYYLTDKGDIGTYEIKAGEPLTWMGINLQDYLEAKSQEVAIGGKDHA